jgi:hypothetical protein
MVFLQLLHYIRCISVAFLFCLLNVFLTNHLDCEHWSEVEWNRRSLGCARDDKWGMVTFVKSRQIGWTERNRHSLRSGRG